MSDVKVYLGEALGRYGFGEDHPFGPDRLGAFEARFRELGLDRQVDIGEPVMATDEEILRFHTDEYLQRVKTQSISGTGYLDYGDTPAFRGVYEVAATVVGTVLAAARGIMAGECRRAFVPIAGLHHARRDSAAGFCVFNDCGIVIETLLAEFKLAPIAYVDIDAHHGDGVFYSFEDEPRVLFADIHEDGRFLYPGTGDAGETGKGRAHDTKLNLPAPPEADDALFDALWSRIEAYLMHHRPQFMILQCGADSIGGDPITHLRFSPACHGKAAQRLAEMAVEFGHGRVLALGGGGYNRANLAAGWTAVVAGLLAGGQG